MYLSRFCTKWSATDESGDDCVYFIPIVLYFSPAEIGPLYCQIRFAVSGGESVNPEATIELSKFTSSKCVSLATRDTFKF